MSTIIKLYARFVSAVPPVIKKLQLVLGLASGSFTAAAAISWPGRLVVVGTLCGYAAAICAGITLGLQFIQQTVTVFESGTANQDQTCPPTTTNTISNKPA